MRAKKPAKSEKIPFTDEQIRAKAYQIWQKYPECSPEENWIAAIKVLNAELRFRPLIRVWQWTGFGEKKLWDFLPLLVVSIILASTGFTLYKFAQEREQSGQADKFTELAVVGESQQKTLANYLDKMEESIKADNLLDAKADKKIIFIAQIRTVTALKSMTLDRQSAIIQFLKAADLYNPNYPSKIASAKKGSKSASQKVSHGLFFKAYLPSIDLAGVNLSGVDLRGANLNEANLDEANLKSADFRGADLRGANLVGSDLSGVDFSGADLSGADLSGANLKESDLSSANLKGTKFCKTTLPDLTVDNDNCPTSK
jgi:uncharacterized protein YjbI with pentapeptide repeats